MLPESLVQSSHVPLFLDGGRAYPAQFHMVPGDGLLKAVPPDIGRSRMSPAVQRPALSKEFCVKDTCYFFLLRRTRHTEVPGLPPYRVQHISWFERIPLSLWSHPPGHHNAPHSDLAKKLRVYFTLLYFTLLYCTVFYFTGNSLWNLYWYCRHSWALSALLRIVAQQQ